MITTYIIQSCDVAQYVALDFCINIMHNEFNIIISVYIWNMVVFVFVARAACILASCPGYNYAGEGKLSKYCRSDF